LFSYKYLYSLEGRIGISTQQSHKQLESIAEEEDENVDTTTNKFSILSQSITPSWLTTKVQGNSNDSALLTTVSKQYEDTPIQKFKLLNSALIDIIVHCVIRFKQSPLPGIYIYIYIYI
jgi:hypothetical protein